MENSSSQIMDSGGMQSYIVRGGLYAVQDALQQLGRVKNEMISTRPVDANGKYEMKLSSKLFNRRRVPIGFVRVSVSVPDGTEDIRVRLEWKRNAYGFWFWKEFTIKNDSWDIDELRVQSIKKEFLPIIQTADGTVALKSMNRIYKKIKNSTARDRVANTGMRRG